MMLWAVKKDGTNRPSLPKVKKMNLRHFLRSLRKKQIVDVFQLGSQLGEIPVKI